MFHNESIKCVITILYSNNCFKMPACLSIQNIYVFCGFQQYFTRAHKR